MPVPNEDRFVVVATRHSPSQWKVQDRWNLTSVAFGSTNRQAEQLAREYAMFKNHLHTLTRLSTEG